MKLDRLVKKKKTSRRTGKRFYTPLDMAVVKHDEAVINSKQKRGELEVKGNRLIAVCGCGVEGCFIHNSYTNKELYPYGNN